MNNMRGAPRSARFARPRGAARPGALRAPPGCCAPRRASRAPGALRAPPRFARPRGARPGKRGGAPPIPGRCAPRRASRERCEHPAFHASARFAHIREAARPGALGAHSGRASHASGASKTRDKVGASEQSPRKTGSERAKAREKLGANEQKPAKNWERASKTRDKLGANEQKPATNWERVSKAREKLH